MASSNEYGRNDMASISATVRVVPSSCADDESMEFFEEILRKATSIEKGDIRHQRRRLKKLVAEHSDKLIRTISSSRDQNFLHFLAEGRTASRTPSSVEGNSAIQKLVARMLLEPGGRDMLVAVDDNQNTPIHTALIGINGRSFLLAISGAPSQPQTIEKVRQTLESDKRPWALHPNGSTFLHAALTSRVLQNDTELLLAIIALAPDDMLRATDNKGRTPLHLAVEHSRYAVRRLDIIQELVWRVPSLLKKTLKNHARYRRDTTELSVYQYFFMSELESHNDSIYPNTSSIARGSPDRRASPVSAAPSVTSGASRGDPNENEESSKIREFLLLESMRIMPCDVAQRCLHVPNEPAKELWFDYMPAPATDMTFTEFKSHWKRLIFESVLKYVSIANISFKPEKGVDQIMRGKRDDATQILRWLKRRQVKRILHVIVDDMGPNYHSNESIGKSLETANVEILDWRRPDLCPSIIFRIGRNLRELHLQWAGNNAILRAWSELDGLPSLAQYGKLKLIVVFWPEDSPDSLSDTEKQKKVFDERFTRHWLAATAQKRSELEESLHGNNSTQENPKDNSLRGQNVVESDDDDANESLQLGPDQMSHPPTSQSSSKRDGVPKRVPPPEIRHTTSRSSAKPKFGTKSSQEGEMDQHRWMQSMEAFTTAFLRVKQPSSEEIATNESFQPAQIALIDDGVDTTNRSLQGKKYYGRSFAFDEAGGRNFPYWMSDGNHGTIMARFIRKLCPTADIYIIKVATRRGTPNSKKLTIDIASAVEAINHAVDRGVRIISMSWSIKPPPRGKLRDDFNKAIQRAEERGIIMFCASSDQGATGNDETYPYDANRANIIRIGAATAMGSNAEYVNKDQVDFLFPGHEVHLKGSTPDKELGNVHKGSSVATAIAAGLAAMVLECVRIGYFCRTRSDNNRGIEPITEHDLRMDSKSIKTAFERMSRAPHRYIWVWETFTEKVCEKITDGGREDQWAIVTDLANQFLLKGR